MRVVLLALLLASVALACSLAIEGRIGEPERKPPVTRCP
jgi:hypothetical protein